MTNLDKLFTITTKERLIRYYIREYEKQRCYVYPACCVAAGRRIENGITIVDLKGGSSKLLTPTCYRFVKIATSLCQDYFPELLAQYRVDLPSA